MIKQIICAHNLSLIIIYPLILVGFADSPTGWTIHQQAGAEFSCKLGTESCTGSPLLQLLYDGPRNS